MEFTPSGGLFQFTYQLADALAQQGHVVDLLTGRDPEITGARPGLRLLANLPTWRPGAAAPEPRLYRKLRRAVRAIRYVIAWRRVLDHVAASQPDAVLWSEWRFPVDGWFVRLLTARSPQPVRALLAHEPRPLGEQRADGLYKGGALLRWSLAGAVARMDVCFVLGPTARDALLGTWPVTGPVVALPHGDYPLLAGDGTPSAATTPPRVLFFGTWTRYKGLDVLLDAFRSVRRHRPDAELVVVGAVSDDVDLRALQREADRIPGVTLRPGYVPLEEVPAVIGGARVVALPYRRASQSGVAHLAHTFARPVVATAVGDLPSAVGEGGRLVPPEDPEALATALRQLLDDPEEAARLGEAGRQRLTERSPWPVAAERVAAAVTQRARDRDRDLEVTVHRLDDAELPAIWRALEAAGPTAPSPFLRWEWVSALLDHPDGAALRVLVARDGTVPVGLFPLQASGPGRGMPLRQVTAPGAGWMGADHLDVVGPPADRHRAATAIVRRVVADRRWDVLDLDGLTADGGLAAAVRALRWRSGLVPLPDEQVPCPYVTLTDPSEQVLFRSQHLRRQVRRGLRNAVRAGGGLEVVTDPDRVGELLEELMTLQRDRYGDASQVFATPANREFHRRAARAMAAGGQARIYRLHGGGESLALLYCLGDGDGVAHYATGGVPRRQSPGIAALGLAIRHAAEEGLRTYDLLRGDEPHKLRFATGVRTDLRLRLVRPGPRTAASAAVRIAGRLRRRVRGG